LWAVIGGLLWAFGPLGKRVGVEGAVNESKDARAALTIFLYNLTTVIVPAMDMLRIDRDEIAATFNSPIWRARIPGIILCGVISGLGGLLGTIAFAYAAGANSALISMIENGMYTVSGAVLIALYYKEHPGWASYVGAGFIVMGVLLAQKSSGEPVKTNASNNSSASNGDRDTDEAAEAFEDSDNTDSSSSEEADQASSDAEDSVRAPTRLRKTSVALAAVAGVCWGFGPIGKKYGVNGADKSEEHAWTTCTYFIYITTTVIVPIARLLMLGPSAAKECQDGKFRWYLLGTLVCGVISGCGGLLSTLAFAKAHESEGAIVSMVENGVYTVFGALLIVLAFKERPSIQQGLAALCVLSGILVAGLG